jgi:histidinol phosphatase-like PHP family hydrolase
MIYDFHTHTFLSDGINSPIELIRYASAEGYRCIAITDHASYSNIDWLIESVTRDCKLAEKYWDITAIPGIELTNVPSEGIDDLAKYAREKGARLVVVHGESIAEKVEPGTNLKALKSDYVDLLAHPGMLTIEEAEIAAKNDIYIEITKRAGHSLTNGIVAKTGTDASVKFLINSDAHSHLDLYKEGLQQKIALASGLEPGQIDEIINRNNMDFLKKLGY